MITVKIEHQELTRLITSIETNSGIMDVLLTIMDGARARWIQLAGEKLKSTRQAYIQGIQPVVGDPAKLIARIELLGVLPNLIEQGMSTLDLHDAFLGGGKGRKTANGRVRVVPFRHSGPNAGYNAGVPMGAPYQGHEEVPDARALGRKIYSAAKKLEPTTSQPGRKTKWGGALAEGLAPHLKPFPMHLSDIYARMHRLEKTYAKKTQSQYITFRTIAVHDDGSPNPQGTWIHPGIPPANLAEETATYIEEIAESAALAYLGTI